MGKLDASVVSLVPLLNVRDVERSLEFYKGVFGFSVLSKWESDGRLAWVRIGSERVELMLNRSEVAANDEEASIRRKKSGAFSDVVLYFEVPDVDALHAKLKNMGILATPPFDNQSGTREMHARDPDGYQLSFTSPLQAA